MLTNIKSECDMPFLKSPPLAHQIIFFLKKVHIFVQNEFNIEYNIHVIQLSTFKHLFVCLYDVKGLDKAIAYTTPVKELSQLII